ncbi:MAG: type II toxin-antitoxin system HicB family antitoxin [Treponema sp.]|jgi:predicted RNase H-like HicB family nuclease|nr:type II toxin-antitoxin system HicB family antitoxin [Treponema sp.]
MGNVYTPAGMKIYLALIEEDNGNYGVVFPDLPGVVSAGTDFDDAIRNAKEILTDFAERMELPEPRTLEQIERSWSDWSEWKERYSFVVTAIPVSPAVETQFSLVINQQLLARIDRVTKNRAEFISKAIEAALP